MQNKVFPDLVPCGAPPGVGRVDEKELLFSRILIDRPPRKLAAIARVWFDAPRSTSFLCLIRFFHNIVDPWVVS